MSLLPGSWDMHIWASLWLAMNNLRENTPKWSNNVKGLSSMPFYGADICIPKWWHKERWKQVSLVVSGSIWNLSGQNWLFADLNASAID